jgi:cytochrome b561
MNNLYTKTAVTLHWLIAILMLANVVMIWFLDHYPDEWVRPVVDTHKSIGITVLGLALMRILWRASHRPPNLEVKSNREKWLAHLVHGMLYMLIIAIPLSGWLHDSAWKAAAEHPMKLFGLFDWPRLSFIMNMQPVAKERLHDLFGSIHALLGYVLYALFILHVAGALKHQFVDKQRQLQRMWFSQ